MPPAVSAGMVKGFTLYMIKAVTSGEGRRTRGPREDDSLAPAWLRDRSGVAAAVAASVRIYRSPSTTSSRRSEGHHTVYIRRGAGAGRAAALIAGGHAIGGSVDIRSDLASQQAADGLALVPDVVEPAPVASMSCEFRLPAKCPPRVVPAARALCRRRRAARPLRRGSVSGRCTRLWVSSSRLKKDAISRSSATVIFCSIAIDGTTRFASIFEIMLFVHPTLVARSRIRMPFRPRRSGREIGRAGVGFGRVAGIAGFDYRRGIGFHHVEPVAAQSLGRCRDRQSCLCIERTHGQKHGNGNFQRLP